MTTPLNHLTFRVTLTACLTVATFVSADTNFPMNSAPHAQQAADDPAGQTQQGVALITGAAGRKDVKSGLALIQKSADSGHPLAQRLMGDILSVGKLTKKDEGAALDFYKRAADAGDPDALSEMGMRYTLGWGVTKDDAEGVRLAKKAVDAGDIAAMMYLASRHETGRGVEKDLPASVALFRRAADRGSAVGMCYLADMYLFGNGAEKSDAEAYRWYTAALMATPPARPIRPVNFITLDKDTRKQCENRRKDAGRALSPQARASAEQAAREWLATVKYPVIP